MWWNLAVLRISTFYFSSTNIGHLSPLQWHTIFVFRDIVTRAIEALQQPYCWDRNHKGQIGIGTYTDSNVPVEVIMPR